MAMEFWGVEVKAGESLMVPQEEGTILHLSQASLGDVKKGNDPVILSVNIEDKRTVLGTLSADKFPQISYDLVFEKDFILSHTGKSGSVHFCGYKADVEDSDSFSELGSEFEEEDMPVAPVENGKLVGKVQKSKASVDKVKAVKPESAAVKSKVKDAKPVIDEDEDSSEEDDDSEDGGEDSVSEDLMSESEDDDEDSSDEEDEDTPTPKNAKQSKKRPAESVTKTPAPEKKAKLVTPQKSGGDGKKGSSHTATPHPSKGGKDKSKPQTPKSGGQIVCKPCSKTFNSDGALQSHTKAKHSDVK